MPSKAQELGALGERLAANELERRGMKILERNHRTREGEIDLITRDGDCLVIVEVRTRRGSRFGTPEESVTPAKKVRLIALAEAYVAQAGWKGPWRIDVVAVQMTGNGRLHRINWVPNAVGGA